MLERLSLDGKVVVITGGGTGLGLAMVRALARAGANVVIAGRRPGPIESAAAEVKALCEKYPLPFKSEVRAQTTSL